MVIEFAGEVVGQDVANAREAMWARRGGVRRRYNRRNVGGCYFFRMDAEHIVDATVKGNESRFINHCCDPNCDARVVNINNENKIIFFANRGQLQVRTHTSLCAQNNLHDRLQLHLHKMARPAPCILLPNLNGYISLLTTRVHN